MLQHLIKCQTASENEKEKKHKGKNITTRRVPVVTSDVSCPLLLFLTGLTEHEIISQVTMFVFAGYETSAIALVFLAYSLARNPEIMKRLQSEIDSTFPNKVESKFPIVELFS